MSGFHEVKKKEFEKNKELLNSEIKREKSSNPYEKRLKERLERLKNKK